MNCGFRPLYPPPGDCCERENCVRMPLFNAESCCSHREHCECAQTVRLENPCCPGECADITLSVDSCGNLVICIRRDHSRCDCHHGPKHHC